MLSEISLAIYLSSHSASFKIITLKYVYDNDRFVLLVLVQGQLGQYFSLHVILMYDLT